MEAPDLIGLADDPGLDFLNSTAVPATVRIELLGDGASYLSWLRQAGLIDDTDAGLIASRFTPAELDAAAADAAGLREFLRPVVEAWATSPDGTLASSAIDRLNAVLAFDRRYPRIEPDQPTGAMSVRERRRWEEAGELLVPPVHAIANLLATADRALVRRCESPVCTLLFYDRTKSHRRRWCSMAVCGNREKARSHRQRVRAGTAERPDRRSH